MVCALFECQKSGKGQVVDAAMVDGSAALMAMMYGLRASGLWTDDRGMNLIDGGAHFYDTYETSDGKYVSVGSIEPQFYALLLEHTGIDDPEFKNQLDLTKWPEFKQRVTEIFKTKTRDEWCDIMEGTDVCFAPVLSLDEAKDHPHNRTRNTFIEVEGVLQPAPAPRFSRTAPETPNPPPKIGQHTEAVLSDFGFGADDIEALKAAEAI
jgi:alpha-methylacyl-CoA racemase